MYKNTSILSYFKPFTQSLLRKRSLPEDSLEEQLAVKRSCSITPAESQSKGSDGREVKCLHLGWKRASSGVRLITLSRKSPGLQAEEPINDNTPAQTSRHRNSSMPLSALSNSPIVRSSQSTSLMSSQRKVKNGEVVIRNSDGESDSDSSLEDLNYLLLLENRKSRVGPSCLERASGLQSNTEDGCRKSTRHRIKTDTVVAPPVCTLPIEPKKYKFDLELLARRRKQEEASSEDISRANAMLGYFEQQKAFGGESAGASSADRSFDTGFIDMVLKEHGSEDEISRLKAAIQRTEAFHRGKSWSFFGDQATEPLLEPMEFPCTDNRLERMLGKTSSRQQAFLSGYVGEYAKKKRLPQELLLWILDAVSVESRDDLRCFYIAALTDASERLTSVLSPERIDMLFRKIGATTAALDIERPVIPLPAQSLSTKAVSRPRLSSILGLLRNLASILSSQTRVHLICTLCRLVLDTSITNNCHTMNLIEDAFASLIESIPEQNLDHELQMVTTTAFTSIVDTTLRLRLLQNIVASSHRLILLRRHLAIAFFFQDIGHLRQHRNSALDLKSIARDLEGPRFTINNATNYGDIAATFGILSIAIDNGDPPPSPYVPEEVKAFNRYIDTLSSQVNSMFADIVDTGASHMVRTEAKEVLEALQYWLSYGVRTQAPPKKALFGDSTFESITNRHMMRKFIEKGHEHASSALPDGVQGQVLPGAVAAS